MTLALPETIAKTLLDEVAVILSASKRYLTNEGLTNEAQTIRRLFRESDKLAKADALAAHSVRAQTYALLGDVDQASYYLNAALHLSNDADVHSLACGVLINLGLFSEGQKHYLYGMNPVSGQYARFGEGGLICGAFKQTRLFLSEARKMQLDLSAFRVDQVEAASRMADLNGLSDEVAGQILDVAGEVLRERHLFWLNPFPDLEIVDVPGELQSIFMTFRVDASSDEAFEMNMRVAELLAERFDSIPWGLHVSFKPS